MMLILFKLLAVVFFALVVWFLWELFSAPAADLDDEREDDR